MLKRHAIQVLRQAGHTLEEIGELVTVGRRSVQRVVAEQFSRGILESIADPFLALDSSWSQAERRGSGLWGRAEQAALGAV